MKKLLALSLLLSPLYGQTNTRANYPDQIKNGPAVIDTDQTFSTLTIACNAAATQHATLNITKSWTNVPTTACNAFVNFVGTVARIQPASGAIFTMNGYSAITRRQVWDMSAGGTVRLAALAVGSPIHAGNFTTLAGACDTANVGASPVLVDTPVSVAASTSCAATVQGVPGGSLVPASGQTVTFAGLVGVPGMLNVGSGGLFASSLTTPQTVQSQWFTGATDYGARVAAAGKLLTSGGGTVDGFTGESGTLNIADGEDITVGCASQKCTFSLAQGNIHCLGVVVLAHTQACIVLRSNNYLTGQGPYKTIVSAYNVPLTGDTGFNHLIETAPDATNVQITNMEWDGRYSVTDCIAQNRKQNHGFSIDGASHVLVDNIYGHGLCGDGNILSGDDIDPNSKSVDVEVKSSTWIGNARIAAVSVDSGYGVNAHDNFCDTSATGDDCMHCEPTAAGNWVRDINYHDNIAYGGTNGGGITCSGYDGTTISSHFQNASIDNNLTYGGRQYTDSIPHSKVTNFILINPGVTTPVAYLASWDGEIGPGVVYSDTAIPSGAAGTVRIDCHTNRVPTGFGNNIVHDIIITNGSYEGIQNFGCNNSQIYSNQINGVCDGGGGVMWGTAVSNDGTNANSGSSVIVRNNILSTTSVCPGPFAIAYADVSSGSRTGFNYYLDNITNGAATERYHFTQAAVSQIKDSVPIAFLGRGTTGTPLQGSWMFCSDCKNVTDDSATFDAVVQSGGHGANMVYEAPPAQQTDWRNH